MNSLETIVEQQAAMVAKLREEYEAGIAGEMEQLYNQFVVFIATAKLPLPHVALVLDMLKQDVVNQSFEAYLRK
jgi:hypothetical protein